MIRMSVWAAVASLSLAAFPALASPVVVTFDDLTLSGSNSYDNGGPTTNTDGWTSQGTFFGNNFTDWGDGFTSWDGFAYSNVNDATTPGFTNQYAAFTGTAFSGTIYAITYAGAQAFINLPAGYRPGSLRITNTTYTAFDLIDGSGFSRPFGPGDSLRVTFTGYSGSSATGLTTGSTTFYLADFRNGGSTIVNTWELLDLTPLGSAVSIGLAWESTDVGEFGINTPQYAAIDDLTLTPVPEPSALALAACGGIAALGAWRRRQRAA
ncbi:MAG: DUF4465 domain-containing protein [Planctomycetaceae bacterium]